MLNDTNDVLLTEIKTLKTKTSKVNLDVRDREGLNY